MPQKRTIPRICEQCGQGFLAPAQQVKRGGARFCGSSCSKKHQALPYMSEKWLERFWSYVVKSDDCWEWQGTRTANGYGTILGDGKRHYAHRVSYEIADGPIPEGLDVCHHCDNPPCINPAHLFLGTATDNARDMAAKGRAGITSKITPAQAEEIRVRYRAGGILQRELAVEYGLSQPTVSEILSDVLWHHP
jgi:hypothetical protein